MSKEKGKINKDYLGQRQTMPGKQNAECETFGRSLLALILNRAMNQLGASSQGEVVVDVKFLVDQATHLGGGNPCAAVRAQSNEELDYGLADRIVITHIET